MKVIMTDDIGSFPYYRIITKSLKLLVLTSKSKIFILFMFVERPMPFQIFGIFFKPKRQISFG